MGVGIRVSVLHCDQSRPDRERCGSDSGTLRNVTDLRLGIVVGDACRSASRRGGVCSRSSDAQSCCAAPRATQTRSRARAAGARTCAGAGTGSRLELASSLDPVERDRPHARRGRRAARRRRRADRRSATASGRRRRSVALRRGSQRRRVERDAAPDAANPDLRALEVVYRYRLEDVDAQSRSSRASALTVALRAEGDDDRLAGGDLAAPDTAAFSARDRGRARGARAPRRARRSRTRCASPRRASSPSSTRSPGSTTGALFYEFLAREIARARRYERYVSLIVFDLDDFKRINDRIGHLAGDAVLAEVAERVRARRPRDRHPVPRRRRRVRGDPARVEPRRRRAPRRPHRARDPRRRRSRRSGPLKISAGVAELRTEDTAADLFKRADDALLRAKSHGKARIVAELGLREPRHTREPPGRARS